MKKTIALVALVVLALAAVSAAAQQKPRIAVIKVENKSPYGGANLGPALEDWLVQGLVQSGKFRVMERKDLDAVLSEQSLSLSGAVDESSITTTDGFFDSSTHSVVFDSSTDPALASLAPGASGIGTFSFTTKSAAAAGSAPQVTFVTSVSGTRVGQTNVPEAVTASATQVAKLATVVNLSAHAYHVLGGFSNTGPVPPRANATTTYAIVWSLANQGSAIAGATVSAALPPYVSYTGATHGSGTVSYDPSSRTVTWTAGNVPPGTTAQAAFQVALLPSTSQKGSAPALTSTVSFSGYDRFAAAQVAATADAPTTETVGDSGYVPTDATVQ